MSELREHVVFLPKADDPDTFLGWRREAVSTSDAIARVAAETGAPPEAVAAMRAYSARSPGCLPPEAVTRDDDPDKAH